MMLSKLTVHVDGQTSGPRAIRSDSSDHGDHSVQLAPQADSELGCDSPNTCLTTLTEQRSARAVDRCPWEPHAREAEGLNETRGLNSPVESSCEASKAFSE